MNSYYATDSSPTYFKYMSVFVANYLANCVIKQTGRCKPEEVGSNRAINANERPLCYFMTPQIFQGDFQENTQMLLVQERAIAVDLELT